MYLGMLVGSTSSLRRQTLADRRSDEEVRADMFAGLLLMPKTAVLRGFAERNLCVPTASAIDVFRVSCWLGVGYSTLLNHLKFALHIIPEERFAELTRHSPKSSGTILERETQEDLVVVDEHWDGRPVDICVGDLLLLPEGRLSKDRVAWKKRIQGVAYCSERSSQESDVLNHRAVGQHS